MSILTATKEWTCECGCEESIQPGEQFEIVVGTFYKKGHREKQVKVKHLTRGSCK
jgi:hypothetical protein